MANVTINSLPAAVTIDPVNDLLPIFQNSSTSTLSISRNTLLALGSAPVGLTDTQTLTNKTLTSPTVNTPTISSPTLSGTLSGTYTIGGTPTFPASVVTLTDTQTLTNKTLTAPSITNATISADTITGFTTSTNGTIYGIAVTGGTIGSSALAANSVTSSAIAQGAVAAAALSTSAITLGYVQITSNQTTSSNTAVALTGVTVTVTIPAGGRKIKITAYLANAVANASATTAMISIWDGTVGSGTQLVEGVAGATMGGSTYLQGGPVMAVVTPAAGSKTYNVGIRSTTGASITSQATSTSPTFILVEAI